MFLQDSEFAHEDSAELKNRFISSLSSGTPISIQSLIDSKVGEDPLHQELMKIEIVWRLQQGQKPNLNEYLQRYPSNHRLVVAAFQEIEKILFQKSDQSSYATLPYPHPTEASARETDTESWESDEMTSPFPLLGDYRIVREIARGGMGVVYQAIHLQLGRIVAMKTIRADHLVDRSVVERFTTEAKAVAKLDHPNIVPVYDFGDYNGQPFLAMAYVDGESLADRVLRDGPLLPATAAKMMVDIVAAVQHAHDRGIIHRDIKPQNILVHGTDKVQITDFGLAKLQDTNSSITRAGQILGTPAYMPPEQATGATGADGEKGDIYSLGATLYYLLTARPPFQAAGLNEILRQVADVEPIRLRQLDPSLPRDLETICLKCLAKDPQLRYPTADALGKDLTRWLRGEPILARRSGVLRNAWMWCRRKPVVAGFTVTAALAISFGGLTILERGRRVVIESEVADQKAAALTQAEEILERGRQSLIAEDYEAASAERQKLLGMEPELLGSADLVARIQNYSVEIDAIREFEIARVQRCGMPSCKFDYVNFNPVDILGRLSLDFQSQTASELSNRIEKTVIQAEIIAALDDWSLVLSEMVNDPYKDYLPKIIEVCNLVDRDKTREAMRLALLGDQQGLAVSVPQLKANELLSLNPTTIVFMANVLTKVGQTPEAINLLSEAYRVYPNNFWLNLRLAEITRGSEGELATLRLKHLEIARVLRPFNTVIIHNLASEYARQGRIEDAKQILNVHIVNAPEDPYLHHAMALLYHTHLDQLEEAVAIYKQNIDLFPEFCQSYLNLAGLVANQGDFDYAQALLEKALPIQRKKCDGETADNAEIYNLAFVYLLMWQVKSATGDAAEVERLKNLTLETLRKVLPYDRDGLYSSLMVTALLQAATEAKEMDLVDQERRYLLEASTLNTAVDQWLVLDRLAKSYYEERDLESSREYISQAAEKLPADNPLYAANILVFASIVNASISLESQSGTPLEQLSVSQAAEEAAVRYLRQALEMEFFDPIQFGIMLSTRQEFRPLDRSRLFWEVVLEAFRRGVVEKSEEAEQPASPAFYFAAQAAVRLATWSIDEPESRTAESSLGLRLQAHQWITKKISILRNAVTNKDLEWSYVNRALNSWKRDPAWIPVRESEELDKLTPVESEMWKAFWEEVNAVQQLTAGG